MFITEVLAGRPYQSYVPAPILPEIPPRYLDVFRNIDSKLELELDGESYQQAHADFIAGAKLNNDRSCSAHEAAREAVGAQSIKKKHLLAVNGVLTRSKTENYRRVPVWIGGPHPSISWHVGSPSVRLDRLIDDVLALQKTSLPTALLILVSVMRILQIHPFSDANGRTARWYAGWLLRRRIGPSEMGLKALSALWLRSEFDLHGASVEIRDSERWDGYLDYAENAFRKG